MGPNLGGAEKAGRGGVRRGSAKKQEGHKKGETQTITPQLYLPQGEMTSPEAQSAGL